MLVAEQCTGHSPLPHSISSSSCFPQQQGALRVYAIETKRCTRPAVECDLHTLHYQHHRHGNKAIGHTGYSARQARVKQEETCLTAETDATQGDLLGTFSLSPLTTWWRRARFVCPACAAPCETCAPGLGDTVSWKHRTQSLIWANSKHTSLMGTCRRLSRCCQATKPGKIYSRTSGNHMCHILR